ncbi:hypothetical protein SISNIDRAFT_498522 [Sistotremastrum niveocremeum HHB9708]|uniref:Uncharacterized protein n=2 Tax=Sistotremastraceae TaxID=3402574 RepID=A0A164N0J5_9AGAM|nr:hypothetical protein SISNIDRAFT_498522 [Sistotremastrum niveocremeum HHB9708]KZT37442.1 hypothetical protein SISSUDRAFT_1120260 [Sistotremastrum suecicum HHB10207 ss-3]
MTTPSAHPFTWDSGPTGFSLKVKGKDRTDYFTIQTYGAGPEIYIPLGTKVEFVRMLATDLIQRVSEDTRDALLQRDIDNKFADCDFWTKAGVKFNKSTALLSGESDSRRFKQSEFKFIFQPQLVEGNSGSKLRNLSNRWKEVYEEAHTYNKRAFSTLSYNPEGRFFTIPEKSRPFLLYLVSHVMWLDTPLLESYCKSITDETTTPDCKFEVIDHAKAVSLGLITISTHPMGFFSTLVTTTNLDKLIELQVANTQGSWIRRVPSLDEVKTFNNTLMKSEENASDALLRGKPVMRKDRFKISQIQGSRSTHNRIPVNESIAKADRVGTDAIMGASANGWAKDILTWPLLPRKPGSASDRSVAEWLHRCAHRFGDPAADYYSNLMFGSWECNTQMIRAESVLSTLGSSKGKIHSLKLITEVKDVKSVEMLDKGGAKVKVDIPWYNTTGDVDKYFAWIAPSLQYTIQVQTTDGRYFAYTTDFFPFHRYFTLQYERKVDKKVMALFLSTITALPGPSTSAGPPPKKKKKSP